MWREATYGDPYSEFVLFNPPKLHHTVVITHTHREDTPGAVGSHLCSGTRGAVGGSVPCSVAPQSGIEGGESAVHSLPPPTILAVLGLELATFGLRVRLSNHLAMTSP